MSAKKSPVHRLQMMGNVEGITLVLLVLVAVPLKHLLDMPELVSVLGPIHGLAFVIYCIWLLECAAADKWKFSDGVKVFLAAFIPFGFLMVRPVFRREEARIRARQQALEPAGVA